MTFRCPRCHASIWVQPVYFDSREAAVPCDQCGQTYVLKAWNKLRKSKHSLGIRARKVAEERGIDLPSAYSYVLGVVNAGKLEELGESASTACRTAPAADDVRIGYDPDYQKAIDEGLLTPRQAVERGYRSSYASILASNHQLPQKIALDVVDNRISLLEAIRQRPEDPATIQVRLANRAARTAAMVVVLALLILLFGLTHDRNVVHVDGETGQVFGAEIRSDGAGRIVQVLGPNPRSVLRAFCAAGDRGRFEPLNVSPSSKPGDRARIGLLRDPSRPQQLLFITIREDRETGQWFAGEGSQPLVAKSAPAGAERAIRGR